MMTNHIGSIKWGVFFTKKIEDRTNIKEAIEMKQDTVINFFVTDRYTTPVNEMTNPEKY